MARKGNTIADSFVNMASVKQRRWRTYHFNNEVERNFVYVMNPERMKTARRESFLPAIHATAWVIAGCIQKNNAPKKATDLFNPIIWRVTKRRQQLAQCKIMSITWYPNGDVPVNCALRIREAVSMGRYKFPPCPWWLTSSKNAWPISDSLSI